MRNISHDAAFTKQARTEVEIQSNKRAMSTQIHAGRSSFCECIYDHLIDKPVTLFSTIMDCIFSAMVTFVGLIINYRYRKKLHEERRARPPDRKGNVIEPIMRLYLNFTIVFWPYTMLFMWINANEVMSVTDC